MLRPHGPRRRFIHDRQGQSLIRTEPEDGAARVVSVRDDAFREVSIIFGAIRRHGDRDHIVPMGCGE